MDDMASRRDNRTAVHHVCVSPKGAGAPADMARSVVTWAEDQAAFAPSKSAGQIGHAATDPQTEAAHISVWLGWL